MVDPRGDACSTTTSLWESLRRPTASRIGGGLCNDWSALQNEL